MTRKMFLIMLGIGWLAWGCGELAHGKHRWHEWRSSSEVADELANRIDEIYAALNPTAIGDGDEQSERAAKCSRLSERLKALVQEYRMQREWEQMQKRKPGDDGQ